jgi:hypothetical protein
MNFLNARNLLLSWAFCGLVCSSAVSYGQGSLYTEGPGVNPPFEDIRDDISNGYAGTTIDVNNAAVEGGIFGSLGIQNDIKIHTLASSVINESAFGNWSRWYQVDGATQIFRLFPGEENVRNSRPLAARIEAFDTNTSWNVDDGQWNEWVARYTIIKPINAAIFQAKDNDDEAWSVHINMNSSGKVSLTHRRPLPGQPKAETLIENAIGQPFDIRIRDNGLDYEVYFGDQSQPFAAGQFVRNADPADNSDTRFRWGIYVGASEVEAEAMIFVSHASVNPNIDYPTDPPVVPGTLIAGWDTWDGSAAKPANVTDGITFGTASNGGFSLDADQRASTDGTWGTLDTPAADATADDNNDTARLTNGASGYYDFTLTDTGGIERALTSFHFDAATLRPNSARNYELSVISGDLTIGSIATGNVPSVVGGTQDWSDFDIPLTGLADRILDANGTVTFRLEFSGGTPGAGGHHQSLDNVAVTAELPVLPSILIAGWDNFDSTSSPTATTTAAGITATAAVTGSGWSRNDGTGRGSSKDTTWGTFEDPAAADTTTTGTGVNLSLVNGAATGDLTFTIINSGTIDLKLNSFHMDAVAFRPNAARTYALNVLSGDMTIGNVFTSADNAITNIGGGLLTDDSDPLTHDQHDDIQIDMLGLADHTLAAGESAIIQIAFSGGTGSGGGHHLFIDNVAFSAAVEATTVLLGDVNLSGTVDFLDISPFISVLSGGTFQAEADCDQSGEVNFLDITPFIAILSGS